MWASMCLFSSSIALVATLAIAPTAQAAGYSGGLRDTLGPRFQRAPQAQTLRPGRPSRAGIDTVNRLRQWNTIAVDASGVDHTPPGPGEARALGEQLGPGRASRAMAIVHIAMFDAVNSVLGGYRSYTGLPRVRGEASASAAVAQAAHDTLAALYPSQAATFAAQLDEDLARIPAGRARSSGVLAGRQAAALILARRDADGSQHAEPRVGIEFTLSPLPGQWRQDPISLSPIALGGHWAGVQPFVLESASRFRLPPPPALDSAAYTAAFREVLRLGGDGVTTPTRRSAEQTEIGVFWAYDGTPSLCAPPRLYNQIATTLIDQLGQPAQPGEVARLLALVNVAMADAAVAIWDSKFHHGFWRPVTAVREADAGSGPSGAGDGNPATRGDRAFTPLGAPASNLTGPNFTPPFPAYPSGHSGFGSALFEVLRSYYGRDRIAFRFVSDEFNGETRGPDGQVRPRIERRFSSLSQAEDENGRSRIYLGIHWGFDITSGRTLGRQVGRAVFEQAFRPAR